VGEAPGVRLLDVACGTGALTAEAARRGAEAVGMDFAPTMIPDATRPRGGVAFQVAGAEAIRLPDSSVDAVTGCVGMLHMERTTAQR